jgi:hypothetical protein
MLDFFRSSEQHYPERVELEATQFLARLNRSARPEFCPLVIPFLRDHLAIKDSLEYAGQFCSTREAYDAVASLGANAEYSKARADALDQIGKRLGISPH